MSAALLHWALQWLIVGPVRRLSRNITAFVEQPEDMSRIIVPRHVFPLEALAEDLKDLAGLTPESGVEIDIAIPQGTIVDADPDQLSRILVNLVRNSVQALSTDLPKAQSGKVRIAATRASHETTIIVSDNGPGIPAPIRANLFVPFQTSTRNGGSGLGLAISNELVAFHGGTPTLDEVAQGTQFRIIIPDRAA